ncbi:hypothetical protein [Haliangium ochraceum]|uniref:RING-type E3 ubiquitin transferase n=1 Tax=Haliangium ochraceum (strain DSM 14365 / JCM 11303 / SMP-2) TaxID=502025 RepID=D0LS02_HALO1|nr:hypothetical protein [Haliangium ochraceum]ACY13699.1 hypothetical protein Hoch_1117 [Haliangium ochraceum DSM 14365]
MLMSYLLLFIGVFVIVVVAISVYFSRDNRIKRAMREARLVSIDAFDETAGMTRLLGTLRYTEPPLTAPLTGRQCALYVAVVEEYRSSGRSGSWHEVIREEAGQDFVLDDGSGTALIRHRGADTVIVKDAHFRSGTFKDATPGLEAFLARHGESSTGMIFNRALRYREGILEAGEQVAVCGRGVREPDPDARTPSPGYREMATRVVMKPSLDFPLYVSDDPDVFN